MSNLSIDVDHCFGSLLEFASNNDVDGFEVSIEHDSRSVNGVGVWYIRDSGSKKIVADDRTPLMVAATYGNIDVMKLILSCSEVDVNLSCGIHKPTALHCAASGGSLSAIDVVKLLLSAGADPKSLDADSHRPVDVIVVHPKLQSLSLSRQELLSVDSNSRKPDVMMVIDNEVVSKKEYPIDPSIADIKNSMYATDEFRMFSFKVRPCSRAYSHDWTECPFVHPGENARRRDPRSFHYSSVPCPEFRKGTCKRGDLCEYAHGVFESWLHPAQYRTRLCKDGISCDRRVCFFAHRRDELRPLYVSNGSPRGSPRASMGSPVGHKSRLRASVDMLLEFDAQQQLINSYSLTPSNLEAEILSLKMNQFQQQSALFPGSPMGPRLAALSRHQLRSFSSRDLGSNSNPVSPWSKWGSPNERMVADWGVNRDDEESELGNNGDEPDLSWVQSLIKESPHEMMKDNFKSQPETIDQSVLGAWVEQMQLA